MNWRSPDGSANCPSSRRLEIKARCHFKLDLYSVLLKYLYNNLSPTLRPDTIMANSSSLSNVVSSLVRAQMGSSIPTNTLDEELDRRVAELILKEAKKSETRYGATGSYSPQPYV